MRITDTIYFQSYSSSQALSTSFVCDWILLLHKYLTSKILDFEINKRNLLIESEI